MPSAAYWAEYNKRLQQNADVEAKNQRTSEIGGLVTGIVGGMVDAHRQRLQEQMKQKAQDNELALKLATAGITDPAVFESLRQEVPHKTTGPEVLASGLSHVPIIGGLFKKVNEPGGMAQADPTAGFTKLSTAVDLAQKRKERDQVVRAGIASIMSQGDDAKNAMLGQLGIPVKSKQEKIAELVKSLDSYYGLNTAPVSPTPASVSATTPAPTPAPAEVLPGLPVQPKTVAAPVPATAPATTVAGPTKAPVAASAGKVNPWVTGFDDAAAAQAKLVGIDLPSKSEVADANYKIDQRRIVTEKAKLDALELSAKKVRETGILPDGTPATPEQMAQADIVINVTASSYQNPQERADKSIIAEEARNRANVRFVTGLRNEITKASKNPKGLSSDQKHAAQMSAIGKLYLATKNDPSEPPQPVPGADPWGPAGPYTTETPQGLAMVFGIGKPDWRGQIIPNKDATTAFATLKTLGLNKTLDPEMIAAIGHGIEGNGPGAGAMTAQVLKEISGVSATATAKQATAPQEAPVNKKDINSIRTRSAQLAAQYGVPSGEKPTPEQTAKIVRQMKNEGY